jgi:dTDP-4-amino-4,6-dideoxygalactose transaminase
MRGKMVPFLDLTRQYRSIKKELLYGTQRVYEKGRFILGEEVSNLEKEFSHYCGVRYGVGVGSGTDALYLALKTAGIFITPSPSLFRRLIRNWDIEEEIFP